MWCHVFLQENILKWLNISLVIYLNRVKFAFGLLILKHLRVHLQAALHFLKYVICCSLKYPQEGLHTSISFRLKRKFTISKIIYTYSFSVFSGYTISILSHTDIFMLLQQVYFFSQASSGDFYTKMK